MAAGRTTPRRSPGGGPGISVADTDVSITDPDSTTIQSARIPIGNQPAIVRRASIAGALPPGITASSYNPLTGILTLTGVGHPGRYQTALHQVVFSTTSPSTADRIIKVTVNDGTFDSNVGDDLHARRSPAGRTSRRRSISTPTIRRPTGADYLTTFTDRGLQPSPS